MRCRMCKGCPHGQLTLICPFASVETGRFRPIVALSIWACGRVHRVQGVKHMRGKFVTFGLILGMVAGVTGAQVPRRTTVDQTAMYCSGAVTSDVVPQDSYVISGEQSVDKVGFIVGQLVYINRGSGQGVKVGDEFLVIRSVKDELKEPWFKGQDELLRA